ncbi:hypothetical protein R3P38DRAFT_3280362 [Favolaschia claudopus]|uniref:Uncharacterized protein n=1 Tax=Favolaschia claudopus TaxID=2862362 RepID=A0AAW0AGB8_9AGAR
MPHPAIDTASSSTSFLLVTHPQRTHLPRGCTPRSRPPPPAFSYTTTAADALPHPHPLHQSISIEDGIEEAGSSYDASRPPAPRAEDAGASPPSTPPHPPLVSPMVHTTFAPSSHVRCTSSVLTPSSYWDARIHLPSTRAETMPNGNARAYLPRSPHVMSSDYALLDLIHLLVSFTILSTCGRGRTPSSSSTSTSAATLLLPHQHPTQTTPHQHPATCMAGPPTTTPRADDAPPRLRPLLIQLKTPPHPFSPASSAARSFPLPPSPLRAASASTHHNHCAQTTGRRTTPLRGHIHVLVLMIAFTPNPRTSPLRRPVSSRALLYHTHSTESGLAIIYHPPPRLSSPNTLFLRSTSPCLALTKQKKRKKRPHTGSAP